jgi:hypothetical protein
MEDKIDTNQEKMVVWIAEMRKDMARRSHGLPRSNGGVSGP